MADNRNPRRQPLRYDVRVEGTYGAGQAWNRTVTRAAKLNTGMLALLNIGQQWATQGGAVHPGTTVSLVDTTDGAKVMLLRWNGFEQNTVDNALNTLSAQGFHLTEVTEDGKQGDQHQDGGFGDD